MRPFHTSSLSVKIIYINLLWKKFEMQEIIKAITKEQEPGPRRSLIHLPTFAFLHNYCLQNQSRVCKEVLLLVDAIFWILVNSLLCWDGYCSAIIKTNLKILCPDFHIFANYLHTGYVVVK